MANIIDDIDFGVRLRASLQQKYPYMIQEITAFPIRGDLYFRNSRKIPLVLRRISYCSYAPRLITANNKSYKSKMTDYKRISESGGYQFIKSDENWNDIAENPFEDGSVQAGDDTFVYFTFDSDSSSSEMQILVKKMVVGDIDGSSDADESQRQGEGVTDGDINVIDANEVKDDFTARSHARAESLWSELGETRQSLIEQNLTTDDYSVVTRDEYTTDNYNAFRAGLMALSTNNNNNMRKKF